MHKAQTRIFKGVSNHNDFTEALRAALQQAQAQADPDALLAWELAATHGHLGGLQSLQQLTVGIRLVGQIERRTQSTSKAATTTASTFVSEEAAFSAVRTAASEATVAPELVTLKGTAGTETKVAMAVDPTNETFVDEVDGPHPVVDTKYHPAGTVPGTHHYVFTFYRRPWRASFEARVGNDHKRVNQSSQGPAGPLVKPDVWEVELQIIAD